MAVYIDNRHTGTPAVSLERIRRTAELLLALCGRGESELSILLLSDPEMREMNRNYRGKDKTTNVLAFAMLEEAELAAGATMLGDLVLSIPTAQREARARGITTHARLDTLLIHGLLHLLGYDHERSEEEERKMSAEEEKVAAQLSKAQRREKMTLLAINVDHVATIREARGGQEPDPVLAAAICELAGAAGIVVHLREDRRHISDRDLRLLRQTVKSKLNLEMGANDEIIAIALELKPDMVTLVPEKRQELTTEGGLNVAGQRKRLGTVIAGFAAAAIPVSLFVDPDSKQIQAAKKVGATFVELHTGRYCDAKNEAERELEFALIERAAEEAYELGLRVYAGHGLNYLTTARVAALDTIEELSIGHAIVSRAVFVGLDQAVREMLAIINQAGR